MIRFTDFEKCGASVAAISEKADGDFGLRSAADPAAVLNNRATFCARCGIDPAHLVTANQVHGARVVRASDADRGRGAVSQATAFREADAMVTGTARLPFAIFVADCVPVYLVAPGRRAVGLVHAGRDGVLLNIVGGAVTMLKREFGIPPSEIHALIGPSVGPCCYEVSVEIAQAFVRAGLPVRGRYPDLWEANAAQLTAAGILPAHITVTSVCTICDGRFHSCRRDPKAGRNMALLMM